MPPQADLFPKAFKLINELKAAGLIVLISGSNPMSLRLAGLPLENYDHVLAPIITPQLAYRLLATLFDKSPESPWFGLDCRSIESEMAHTAFILYGQPLLLEAYLELIKEGVDHKTAKWRVSSMVNRHFGVQGSRRSLIYKLRKLFLRDTVQWLSPVRFVVPIDWTSISDKRSQKLIKLGEDLNSSHTSLVVPLPCAMEFHIPFSITVKIMNSNPLSEVLQSTARQLFEQPDSHFDYFLLEQLIRPSILRDHIYTVTEFTEPQSLHLGVVAGIEKLWEWCIAVHKHGCWILTLPAVKNTSKDVNPRAPEHIAFKFGAIEASAALSVQALEKFYMTAEEEQESAVYFLLSKAPVLTKFDTQSTAFYKKYIVMSGEELLERCPRPERFGPEEDVAKSAARHRSRCLPVPQRSRCGRRRRGRLVMPGHKARTVVPIGIKQKRNPFFCVGSMKRNKAAAVVVMPHSHPKNVITRTHNRAAGLSCNDLAGREGPTSFLLAATPGVITHRRLESTPEAIMGGGGGVGLRLSATGDLPRGSISGSDSVYTHSRNQNNPGSYMNSNGAETGPAEKPYRPTYSTTKKRFQSVAARAKAGGVKQAPKQPLLETPALVISQPPASLSPSPPNSIPATTEPGKTAAVQPAVELDKVVSVSPPLGVKIPSVGDSISSTDAQVPNAPTGRNGYDNTPMVVTTGDTEEEKPKLNLREVAKHALYVKNSGGSTVDAKIIRRLNVTICDLQQQVRVLKTENLKLRKERDLLKTNLKHSQSRYVALQKKINPLDLPADEPLPNDENSPAEVPRTESPYEWTLKKEGGSIVAVMEPTAPTKGPEPRPRKLTEQEQLKLHKNLEFLQSLALLFTKGGIVMGPSGAVNMRQAASSVPTPTASTPSLQAMKLIFTPAGTVYVPVEQIEQLPKSKNSKSAPRTTKPSTNASSTYGTKPSPPTPNNNNKPAPAEPPQQPPQPQPLKPQQQEPKQQPPQAELPVPQTFQL
ncbi:hypothetical protein Pelo_8206 [Pelomyxa schiedti]|nr:hypothetical protein Pelo_8206 [Pelomyxa schiedti]